MRRFGRIFAHQVQMCCPVNSGLGPCRRTLTSWHWTLSAAGARAKRRATVDTVFAPMAHRGCWGAMLTGAGIRPEWAKWSPVGTQYGTTRSASVRSPCPECGLGNRTTGTQGGKNGRCLYQHRGSAKWATNEPSARPSGRGTKRASHRRASLTPILASCRGPRAGQRKPNDLRPRRVTRSGPRSGLFRRAAARPRGAAAPRRAGPFPIATGRPCRSRPADAARPPKRPPS